MRAAKNGGKKAKDYQESAGTARARSYVQLEHLVSREEEILLPEENNPDARFTMCLEVHIDALIMHAFDQKTMEQVLSKQMGILQEREPKVPRTCLERATLRNADGKICILPVAFKKSIISGATGLESTSGMNLRSKMFVTGHSIPITYETQSNRVDMVRVGQFPNKVADVRFRPQFDGVTAHLVIRYPGKIPAQTMVDLVNRGGQYGVGEWRPEKGGSFGAYRVVGVVSDIKEISRIMSEQSVRVPPLTIPDWALDHEISTVLAAKIMSGDYSEEEEGCRPATKEELEAHLGRPATKEELAEFFREVTA